MTGYRLRYDRHFLQLLEALPGDVRTVARQTIKNLTQAPRPGASKELVDHPTYYRLWLPRNHRLVWQVLDDEQIIDLLYIGPKTDDLYERLGIERKR